MCSLTVDGGLVPLMDLVIVKLFPEAYMTGDKGSREPPWDAVEEARRASVWKVRAARLSSRLTDAGPTRVRVGTTE